MTEINNLESFAQDYFLDPENAKNAQKATEHFNRLMVKNLKRHLATGGETVTFDDAMADDPGKRMEKARYTYMKDISYEGKQGQLKIDLVDQKMDFIPNK